MKAQFKASVAAVALAGAPIAVFVPAYAQGTSGDVAPAQERTEGGAPETVGIGEIVVTAQKREQRLNDVGLSVSVASGEQIQNAGITDAADLGAIVPGFTASTSVFGPPVFSLRGVNFNSFQASAPPTVRVQAKGAMAFERTPKRCMSSAIDFDRPTMPSLAAA